MSNLSHERVHDYLHAGRASLMLDEQAALNDHLQECAECRAYADRTARLHAALTQTMRLRWDTQPIPEFVPRVMPRLQKNKLPQQIFNYAVGLSALVALILLLQAFFTTQLQHTAQSPLATSTPFLESTMVVATPNDVRPTPTPIQIALLDSATIKVNRVSFWPDQSVVFDWNVASDFGLEIQAKAAISTTVHVVAYGLRPDEPWVECLARSVPTDRPFWANQADYAAGEITFDQHFMFADEQVGADRFVVRLSVLDAAAQDRLLYCAQQVYAVSFNMTPASPTPVPPYTATPVSTSDVVPPTSQPTRYETPTPPLVPLTPTSTVTRDVRPTSTPRSPRTPFSTVTPYGQPTSTPIPTNVFPTSTPYGQPTSTPVPTSVFPTSTPYGQPTSTPMPLPTPTPIELPMTPTACTGDC